MNSTPSRRTNPARRLLKILSRGMEIKGGHAREALAQIFKLQNNDVAAIYLKFSNLLLLVEEVDIRLQALPSENREIYLRCIPPVRRAFQSLAMEGSWNSYVGPITQTDLGVLHLAAEALDAVHCELEIPEDELSGVVADATALYERVRKSTVDPELRLILMELLELMRRTVADYQIKGAEGLKKVLAESWGRMALDKEIVLRGKNEPEMKQFWTLIDRISKLFTLANNAPQIGEKIGNFVAGFLN